MNTDLLIYVEKLLKIDATDSFNYRCRIVSGRAHHDQPFGIDSYAISRGIGLESSILFAQEGANVILADINLDAAEKGATLISNRFPNIKTVPVKTDVGKEADIKAAVDLAIREFGRLDVMVGLIVALINVVVRVENHEFHSSIMLVNQLSELGLMGS
jgi:hypothetical protein